MAARPRELVFGGRVSAVAVWLDPALLGEAEARRRVIALSLEGGRISRTAGGYLVAFASPEILDANHCLGTPVIEQDGAWIGAPLRAEERPPGQLLLVQGGRVAAHERESEPVDVAAWLDVSDWRALKTVPIGHAPARGAAPTLVAPPEPTGVREILGDRVPPPAPERDAVLEALARGRPPTAGELGGGGGDGEPGFFERLIERLFGRSEEVGGAIGGAVHPPGLAPAPAREPGRVQTWLRNLLLGSPLSRLIGRRQAEYVYRTLDMFEKGRWDEALRHAIPFGAAPGRTLPPALSVPSPRAELTLGAARAPGPSTSIGLGGDLYERFTALYRKAARALEEAGRIEEAAFVLFELLSEPEEGIALLERHGRYELAAQMALGRDMPAGLVIRLWFLAGKPARAILVARRTGAYADAIDRLQARHPEAARRLRLLWADRLAAGGDYAAAVDAVWPTGQKALAKVWVERAIEFGGPTACRMLAKKLERWRGDPEVVQQVEDQAAAVITDAAGDAPALRAALARALIDMAKPRPPATAAIARRLTRRLMLDANVDVVRDLQAITGDPVLRFDTPTALDVKRPVPLRRNKEFPAHERGLAELHDAVGLPNGRFLVALGEAGARLIDARGRTLRQYQHPAFELVLSDSGSRAISIATRGQTATLRRFDLASGASEAWCDARFGLHAPGYDGALWYLCTEDAVAAVDAQAEGFPALWRVSGLPAPPVAIARDRSWLVFATHDGGTQLEVWRYELGVGGPALRRRRLVELPAAAKWRIAVNPAGRVAAAQDVGIDVGPPRLVTAALDGPIVESRIPASADPVAWHGHLVLVMGIDPELLSMRYEATAFDDRLHLAGARRITTHLCGNTVLVADDRGRLVELDSDLEIARWLLV